MTKVIFGLKTLINTGNYENIEVSIGIEDEPRGEENTTQAFRRVRKFVDDRMEEAVNDIRSQNK